MMNGFIVAVSLSSELCQWVLYEVEGEEENLFRKEHFVSKKRSVSLLFYLLSDLFERNRGDLTREWERKT
jgi:hypothetical protein